MPYPYKQQRKDGVKVWHVEFVECGPAADAYLTKQAKAKIFIYGVCAVSHAGKLLVGITTCQTTYLKAITLKTKRSSGLLVKTTPEATTHSDDSVN